MVNTFLGKLMSTRWKEQKAGQKVCCETLVTALLNACYPVYSSLQVFERKVCTAEQHI